MCVEAYEYTSTPRLEDPYMPSGGFVVLVLVSLQLDD